MSATCSSLHCFLLYIAFSIKASCLSKYSNLPTAYIRTSTTISVYCTIVAICKKDIEIQVLRAKYAGLTESVLKLKGAAC